MSSWSTQDEKAHSVVPYDIVEYEESIRTMQDIDVELKSGLCCVAGSVAFGEIKGSQSSCSCTNSTKKYMSNKQGNLRY